MDDNSAELVIPIYEDEIERIRARRVRELREVLERRLGKTIGKIMVDNITGCYITGCYDIDE